MRKIFALLAGAMLSLTAMAVPAHPGLVDINQPDGTRVTIRLVGDEFFNYTCTSDGYTLVQVSTGHYEYASLSGGRLVASGRLAHNAEARTADEQAFLAQTGKHLIDITTARAARAQRSKRDSSLTPARAGALNNYRGLVILVNMTNKKFKRTDAQAFYQSQTNDRNYTGYTDQSSHQWVSCTGSVRDYFYDNSMGQFDPQFDVVGPITVNYTATGFQQTSNAHTIFNAAIEQVKNQVDFSNYDADNDGVVDMVYFIVAGYGSNYEGNNSSYLWPHASSFYGNYNYYNGKRLGRYACSVELDGLEYYGGTIGGIGTMCHEFSHVLGVADHYDTDYEQSGGQSNHPGEWDVMAGGSYFNNGRTPCGYTLFERYTMGFASPTVITEPGVYTLNPVHSSNQGYIIKSPVSREYFILDNRQKVKWDVYIPGHGMLVWRVDSTNTGAWSSNKVNANPEHNYLEIVRAGQASSASATDPFPGSYGVTSLGAQTTPALVTWNGYYTELGLAGIKEQGGVITFTAYVQGENKTVIEDFEHMPPSTTGRAANVQGNFSTWTFANCNVVNAPDSVCNGRRAVALINPCNFYMTQALPATPFLLSYHAYNYSGTTAKLRVEYKDPDATSWTTLNTQDVPSGTDQVVSCSIDISGNKVFRFSQPGGNKTKPVYIDDITFYYMGDDVPVHHFDDLRGDINGDGLVDVADVNELVNIILGKVTTGVDLTVSDLSGDGIVDVADVNELINIILGK